MDDEVRLERRTVQEILWGFFGEECTRLGGTAKSSCNVCAFVSTLSGKLMTRAVLHSVVIVSL